MSTAEDIVEAILALPRPLLVTFDVDGTLAPIVDNPGDARVPDALQGDLRRLSRRDGVAVAVLTGRDHRALSSMLRVPGIYRGFEHGRVIVAPGARPRTRRLSAEQREALAAFERWATKHALPQGAELEDKPESRVLHVRRLARRDPERAEAVLEEGAAAARTLALHVREGRHVLEAELSPGDKGVALEKLIELTRARGVVYCGDDITDIPALRVATKRGGVGVFVRSKERPRKPTGISHSVDGPEHIARLVEALATRG